MKDPLEFNEKISSVYAKFLTLLIYGNINSVRKLLAKDDFPIDFPDRDVNIISNELLFYYLNICDRELHNEYDHEIKTRIMNALIDCMVWAMDETKEDILKERFEALTNLDGLEAYFKVLRTMCDARWFFTMFNKRQREYEGYLNPLEAKNSKDIDIDKTLESKFAEIVHLQVFKFDIQKNPVPEVKMILYSIALDGNFYVQLIQVISKIEQQIGLSNTRE